LFLKVNMITDNESIRSQVYISQDLSDDEVIRDATGEFNL
jgi:hypothetical protein